MQLDEFAGGSEREAADQGDATNHNEIVVSAQEVFMSQPQRGKLTAGPTPQEPFPQPTFVEIEGELTAG